MMSSKKYIASLVCMIACTFACQEIIDLDLEQSNPRVVVEGFLTDEDKIQKVRVSRSLNYYDTGKMEPITNAQVTIYNTNESGEQYELSYNEQDSNYQTANPVSFQLENEYKVEINVEAELYEANGTMLLNADLDSIYYFTAEQLQQIGQPSFGEGYFLFVDGSLNNTGIEYFKLNIFVNDTLKDGRGDLSNSILSSEFFGKEFQFLPVPGSFEEKDTVTLELQTLNEDVYRYYIEFINLLFNDGGVFSPPPVNPTTNIKNITNPENEALGFIQFSSVNKSKIVIEK